MAVVFLSTILLSVSFLFNAPLYASCEEIQPSQVKQKIFHKDFSVEQNYEGYTGQGVPYNLKKVIVSVSAFTKKDGTYTFAFNEEAVLDLSRDEQKVHATIPAIPPAAIAVALLVEGDLPLAKDVYPRRLITSLSDHIFKFGQNIKPSEVTLMITNKIEDEGEIVDRTKVTMSLRTTIDGIDEFHVSTAALQSRALQDSHDLLSAEKAMHVTRRSAATAEDSFNFFWYDYLNREQAS